MPEIDRHASLKAYDGVIAALETELDRVRRLRASYDHHAPSVSPAALRHFCAGLVETAIDLARTVNGAT
jgi:hypothetical protein